MAYNGMHLRSAWDLKNVRPVEMLNWKCKVEYADKAYLLTVQPQTEPATLLLLKFHRLPAFCKCNVMRRFTC
jgi:hypothetical protein